MQKGLASRSFACASLLALTAGLALIVWTGSSRPRAGELSAAVLQPDPPAVGDIDAFMEKVLERRDLDRLKMRDYVIDERETLELAAPGGLVVEGWRKEFVWYVRDGILVRSPVRFDGVTIGEVERQEYERRWIAEEHRRAARRRTTRRTVSRRTTAENIAIAAEREWGRPIDDGLARTIARDAAVVGDDQAALVLHTGDVITALGGVDAVGVGLAAARTRDLFVMLDRQLLTPEEVDGALDETLVPLAERAETAPAGDFDLFVELVRLAGRFGTTPAASDRALRQLTSRLEARADSGDRVRMLSQARATWNEGGAGGRTGGQSDSSTSSGQLLAPRFLSEAYFLNFKFDPGNYFFAGREQLAGRDVVRIEYYPERWFDDDKPSRDDADQSEIGMKLNKTSLVTLWIDPDHLRIVKFTFDNVGLDFLPGRWLLRVDELNASMVMGQPFDGVWMPQTITAGGRVTTAAGWLELGYRREFYEYREADVGASIRSYEQIDGQPHR